MGSAARLFHLNMNKIARFCGVQRKYSRLHHHHLIAAPAQPHNVGAMMAECALDVCYGCMEKNKKSPRWGCEGRRPFVGVMSKSNVKQAPPLSFAFSPTVTRHARRSPPSPLRQKSRFAKKKSATPKKTRLPQKLLQHRVEGRRMPPPCNPCVPHYQTAY